MRAAVSLLAASLLFACDPQPTGADRVGSSSQPASSGSQPPPTELGCAFAAPVTLAGATSGRVAPAIAPGAVILTTGEGAARRTEWQALELTGKPRGARVSLEVPYVSPRGMVEHGDGYLVVGEGAGGAVLLELGADGSARRRLELERAAWASFAAVAAMPGWALVAWRDRTKRSVRSCVVDLQAWACVARPQLPEAGSWSQSPRLAAVGNRFSVSWAESDKGEPPQTRRAWLQRQGGVWAATPARAVGRPPSVPVGSLRSGGRAPLLYAEGTQRRVVLLEAPGEGAASEVVAIDEAILYVAVAELTTGAALFYVDDGEPKLLRLSDRGATTLPHSLGPSGSARNPAAASRDGRLWLAWDHVDADGAATVEIRTALCR